MDRARAMPEVPANTEPKRVFIVEDHPIVRMGLTQLLSLESDLELCGEAERVDEAIEKLREAHPHVVLVDIGLPGANGMELIRYIKDHWVGVKIIVVSTYDETVYGSVATDAGADCYINKHEAMDQIVKAIRSVINKKPGEGFDGCKTAHWFG